MTVNGKLNLSAQLNMGVYSALVVNAGASIDLNGITYQWQKDKVDILNATSKSYSFVVDSLLYSQKPVYRCKVKNVADSVFSNSWMISNNDVSKIKNNDTLKFKEHDYGSNLGKVYFNALDMTVSTWSNDSVKVKIPSSMPRGYYTIKIYNGGNTLIDSVYHGVRVIKPSITGIE